jgi:hypothetical protein
MALTLLSPAWALRSSLPCRSAHGVGVCRCASAKPRPRSPLDWRQVTVPPTELHWVGRNPAVKGGGGRGTRHALPEAVREISKVVRWEISVATGVSPVVVPAWSRRLTTRGSKTYPSAAAREGSVRVSSPISMLPSRSQADQCQGRRPFKEFFQ